MGGRDGCDAAFHALGARAERAIWSDLRLPSDAAKPAIPAHRGALTIADVSRASTPDAFDAVVDTWIADVWAAWQARHALARRWLEYSIAAARRADR